MRLLTLLAFLLVSPVLLAKAPDIDKVNGSIRAQAGQEYGKLATVNGSIHLESHSRAASASTVNGSIRAEGEVQVGKLETVNGSIRLDEATRVGGAAQTVNGSITLARDASIDGRTSTVNGSIKLDRAHVGGGLQTVRGDITVGEGSTVEGGILIEKPNLGWISWGEHKPPRVVVGPRAVVEGELRFEHEVELLVHDSARIGPVSGATAVRYSGEPPARR